MAITVNGVGYGAGGIIGKIHYAYIDAGTAGYVASMGSAYNTPAASAMAELLNVDGPGRLLCCAVFSCATGNNSSPVRVRIEADEDVIRYGSSVGGGSPTGNAGGVVFRSDCPRYDVSDIGPYVRFFVQYVDNSEVKKFSRSAIGVGSLGSNDASNRATYIGLRVDQDGILNEEAAACENGLYFEDSLKIYAVFGNSQSASPAIPYAERNAIFVIYETFE